MLLAAPSLDVEGPRCSEKHLPFFKTYSLFEKHDSIFQSGTFFFVPFGEVSFSFKFTPLSSCPLPVSLLVFGMQQCRMPESFYHKAG